MANSAKNGGALYNDGSSTGGNSNPVITNSTFTNNSASSDGGALYNKGNDGTSNPLIRNTIFWNNTGSGNSWANNSASPDVDFSLVQEADANTITSGKYAGSRLGARIVYNSDPSFSNPSSDFTLGNSSPAIDKGTSAALPAGTTTDLAGNARVMSLYP